MSNVKDLLKKLRETRPTAPSAGSSSVASTEDEAPVDGTTGVQKPPSDAYNLQSPAPVEQLAPSDEPAGPPPTIAGLVPTLGDVSSVDELPGRFSRDLSMVSGQLFAKKPADDGERITRIFEFFAPY